MAPEDLGDVVSVEIFCLQAVPRTVAVLAHHLLILADAGSHQQSTTQVLPVAFWVRLRVLGHEAFCTELIALILVFLLALRSPMVRAASHSNAGTDQSVLGRSGVHFLHATFREGLVRRHLMFAT